MSSRTVVRALHRSLTVLLVVTICTSQFSIALAGNYRIGAVGGVVIQIDGVVRDATVDQRTALAKLRREEFQQPPSDLNRAVEIRKISLRALEAACQHYLTENSGKVPDEIKYLGGLQRVQYVFVYPEQNDIVLAGPAEGWKIDDAGNVVGETTGHPVLQLDDLVVALRTVTSAREGGISCSINPTAAGMKALNAVLEQQRQSGQQLNRAVLEPKMQQAFGPQEIALTGVPASSHFARVLVAADYRMKRLAMNLDPSPVRGLPSYVEMLKGDPSEVKNVNPRWWMACNYEPVAKSDDNLAWELRGQGVKCLTENDVIAGDGNAQATGQASPIAQKWADTMTEKFDALAAKEPIFGELRNVMDLCVVAAIIDQYDLTSQAGCSLPLLSGSGSELTPEHWFAPKTVPPQCSFLKTRAGWVVTASGGVQIESFRVASRVEPSEAIKQVRTSAGTPTGTNWYWN